MKFNQVFHFINFSGHLNLQTFKVVCISFSRDDEDTIYGLEIRAETLNIYARIAYQFFIID